MFNLSILCNDEGKRLILLGFQAICIIYIYDLNYPGKVLLD
jgi:hypothetical protein